jgi:thiamine biosynthesis lipoprotein
MKRAICILLIFSFVFSLAACDKPAPTVHERYLLTYFNTDTILQDYSGGDRDTFNRRASRVEEIFEYYHKLFDIYNEYSGMNNIATLNRLAGEGPVSVPSELIDFLIFCKNMHEITGGEVNVAFGAVLSIWHEHRTAKGEKTLPDMQELLAAAEHCDINDVVIDESAGTVELLDPEMSLDVGAIGKGYATEMAAQLLILNGITSYVLNIGGNIRAVGEKPSGDGWLTGVTNPNNSSDEPYITKLTIKDTSIVTSGNYERFHTVNGINYHHIIDPDTLMPADYFTSISVMTSDSALADALSTALFCMSYEDGLELISSIEGADAVWIYNTGEIKCTSGIKRLS